MEKTHEFLQYLQALYPVSPTFSQKVRELTQFTLIKKGEILNISKPASIWYIHRGLLKGGYDDLDGRQHITSFWKEMEVVLMIHPVSEGFYATALEDGYLTYLSGRKLLYLYNHFGETAKLASKILSAEQSKSLLKLYLSTLPASAAYQQFKNSFPYRRILLKDIASYLEITPGTLSEVRRIKNL